MCDVIGKAVALEASMTRRGLLRNTGIATVATAAGGRLLTGEAAAARGRGNGASPRGGGGGASRHRTRLVLLGTAGGPVVLPGAEDRHGISSAVVVDGAVYLVDCGLGFLRRYQEAGIGPKDNGPFSRMLVSLRAVFLTHMHSDHTVEYPALQLFGHLSGLNDPSREVGIFGPGDRGALPPVFGNRPEPPVVNPEDPTPGIEAMTGYLRQAFAADLNDRIRDSGFVDPGLVFAPHDIRLPRGAGDDPNSDPAPLVDPFPVFEDDRVRVTATLVKHPPTFPSMGFRFDSDEGSVTFSGDTAPTPNLIKLAQGTDVLVHEVIDEAWVRGLFGPGPHPPQIQAIIEHLLQSHTTIEQVGPIAEEAGAGTLVLNHLAPANNPERRWRKAGRGFSGRLIVGEDLMHIGVGARRARGSRTRQAR
ncbi:MAG: MBL fold metallo-hydrolase [Thermoleophilaceae bacterium]